MCHGGTDNQTGAPPKTTWGNATDAVRVGTHTAHVAATHGLAAAVACATCHVQPVDALSAGHVDGATAEVVFSGRAIQGVVTAPGWTRATATCSNTYCHGATLQGGTATAPVWTRTDGTQRACTSCHGAPPPAPHSTSTACANCHGAGYSATTVNAATHMNGVLDVSGMTCTSCHGTAGRAATTLNPQLPASPPVGTKGETLTTTRAVGAHQAHLVNTRLRLAAIACSECHTVPTSTSHANSVVDMTWGTLTRTGGVVPTWTGTTCTNYCHGANLFGGTITAPTWTGGPSQASACTACHGAPPPAPHSQSTTCASCHTGYTATTVNPATHMNGAVDVVAMTCTSCHGTATRAATTLNPQLAAAPPVDTAGNTATTFRGVGAHMKHLSTSATSSNFACTECHTVPTATSHANGTKDLVFGTLAKTGGKVPAYNATTLGCSATYCHGNFTGGTTTAVPIWTGAAMTCTSCHGAPPSTGHHQTHQQGKATNCQHCHSGIATGTGYPSANAALVPAGVALHVNGAKNLAFGGTYSGRAVTMTVTRNGTTITCNGSCHGSKTW
jgi:predicted CxxxxCH...CXXCH cytochrome family protein